MFRELLLISLKNSTAMVFVAKGLHLVRHQFISHVPVQQTAPPSPVQKLPRGPWDRRPPPDHAKHQEIELRTRDGMSNSKKR